MYTIDQSPSFRRSAFMSCSRCRLPSGQAGSTQNKASAAIQQQITGRGPVGRRTSAAPASAPSPSSSFAFDSPAKEKNWNAFLRALPAGGVLAQRAKRAAPREEVAKLNSLMENLRDFPPLVEGEVSYQDLYRLVVENLQEISQRAS